MSKKSQHTEESSDDHEKRIVQNLRQLSQYLNQHSRQLLKNQGVTIQQVMCLDLLCNEGQATVAVLAKRLHLSASTTVGIIDRLEKRNLLSRLRDSVDRRLVNVDVTAEGRQFIQDAPHLLHNRLHGNISTLSAHERKQIAESLDRLLLLVTSKD